MGVDRGKRSKQNRRVEYDAWAPNNLLVVKIQILAIFIHSWANEYKLFSPLKCPIFQRELINFLFPRAPLAQLSLIGTPGERAPEAKKGTQGPEGGLIGNSMVISFTSSTSTVVNLRNTNHTPTTSRDKSNLRVGAWGQVGPCERCNIFRTASGGVTMTDSNRMLPACPQPITGKPLLSVQLVMKCRQALACCATGTCAKGHVKNSGTFSCFCNCGQWHGLSVVNGTYHNLSLLF